jgi:hypothetical protein
LLDIYITIPHKELLHDSIPKGSSSGNDDDPLGIQTQDTDIHAPAGFESVIPASKEPQTHPLDGTATAIGTLIITYVKF